MIEDKNTIVPQDIAPTATKEVSAPIEQNTQASIAEKECPPCPPPQMSKGERAYNWAVYSGINYWVNLISSIAIADYLIHKGGRNKLDWAIGKGAQALASTKLMGLKPAYKHTKTALETLSLMSGGWALLIPMKILEDHKRSAVHWLNDKMGVDQTAADGHKMTADEIYIEQEQPKQSWFTAIKRRVYATLSVVASGQIIEHALADKKTMTPDHTFHINPYDTTSERLTFEGHHVGGKQWAEHKIVGGVNWVANKLPGGDKFTKPGSWQQRWLGLAALDTGFTKITAIVMKMTNGAGKAHAPHETNIDHSPSATFEIGDSGVDANTNRISEAVPKKPASDIINRKNKDENFAAAASRRAEAANRLQTSI